MIEPGGYIKDILAMQPGASVTAQGWVKTRRDSKGISFVQLSDGSCFRDLQVIVDEGVLDPETLKLVTTGACVKFEGEIVESPAAGQPIELRAKGAEVFGPADPQTYPLQKKGASFEFLREIAHLRCRGNTFGAVFRVRNQAAWAIHKFFQDRGFHYVQTPIITASDCEGAGAMFAVSTLLEAQTQGSGFRVQGSGSGNDTDTATGQLGDRTAGDEGRGTRDEGPARPHPTPHTPNPRPQTLDPSPHTPHPTPHFALRSTDPADDFFGKPAFLTVSGQLEAESVALGMANVYTFGPTFRAENSNSARHLAEFWMVEPEMAFCDLQGDMKLAEDFLKYVLAHVLDACAQDLEFFNARIEKDLLATLEHVAESDFEHLSYSEAVQMLEQSGEAFEFPVSWGTDLQSEHERWLTETKVRRPVILTDYPKEIKPFYMRQNDDGTTVRAMDVLAPRIGEIIGGSQREERLEALETRIKEMNLPIEAYWWYMDLRRFGSAPHAGFGLGFERLLMYLTGMKNIRDVIPFHRTPGHAEF